MSDWRCHCVVGQAAGASPGAGGVVPVLEELPKWAVLRDSLQVRLVINQMTYINLLAVALWKQMHLDSFHGASCRLLAPAPD